MSFSEEESEFKGPYVNPFADMSSDSSVDLGTAPMDPVDPVPLEPEVEPKRHKRQVRFSTAAKRCSTTSERSVDDPLNLSIGAEPGVDIDTVVDLPDSQGSHIVVMDYSPDHYKTAQYDLQRGFNSTITGSTDKAMLHKNFSDVLDTKPRWSQVRWIVVNGLSWEAIHPLVQKFALHPLAVEDMLDIPQRTKSEVFKDQIFCCLPMHYLSTTPTPFTAVKSVCRMIVKLVYKFLMLFKTKEAAPEKQMDFDVGDADTACVPFFTITGAVTCAEDSLVNTSLKQLPQRSMYDYGFGNNILKQEALQHMHIPGTTKSFEINVEQVSIFIVNNTVITFFEKQARKIYKPIERRLFQGSSTLLRHTSDPLTLLQAIFDADVDLFAPILDEYRKRLSTLQIKGIKQPSFHSTQALHAFMTDLMILRSPLDSLSALVDAFGSKPYQRDRNRASRKSIMKQESQDFVHQSISTETALYFNDVADHTISYLHDVDNMRLQTQTLSSLVFNTISIRAGDSVKMLSLVSVVFLPLTFLTGYFGMNFTQFNMLDNDVGYYWLIASPATVVLTGIVMYQSILTKLRELWTWAKDQV